MVQGLIVLALPLQDFRASACFFLPPSPARIRPLAAGLLPPSWDRHACPLAAGLQPPSQDLHACPLDAGLQPPSQALRANAPWLQDFSARTLAEMLWAVASLRWAPSPAWLDRALAAVGSKVQQLRPGEVAITAWALSRLRCGVRLAQAGRLLNLGGAFAGGGQGTAWVAEPPQVRFVVLEGAEAPKEAASQSPWQPGVHGCEVPTSQGGLVLWLPGT